jgi:hypothetical protein
VVYLIEYIESKINKRLDNRKVDVEPKIMYKKGIMRVLTLAALI